MKTDDTDLTQRILHNFARESRVYREYTLCGNWGYISFTSHPRFFTGLMNKLDQIDEIKEKEIYQRRSIPDSRFFVVQPTELYFDFDKQTIEYPYQAYEEKIKEKLDNELNC